MTTANNDLATKELQKFVTCAICLHQYSDPRLLPCSHTYCFECIQNLINNGIFQCPMRDDTNNLTENAMVTLPTNCIAKNMIELVSKMSLSSENQQQMKCYNCDEQSAAFWCQECSCNYCNQCEKAVHAIKSHHSHNIMLLSEKLSLFCTDHLEEKYEYWCKQCQLLLCRNCVLSNHKMHEYQSTEEAAAVVKIKVYDSMQEFTKKEDDCSQLLTKVKILIKQQQDLHRIEKDELRKTFISLQKWLENQQNLLTKELEHKNGEIMSSLMDHERSVREQLELLEMRKCYANELMNNTNNVQLLKQINALLLNCDDVERQKLQSVETKLVFKGEQVQLYRQSLSNIAFVEINDSSIWSLGIPKDVDDIKGITHYPEGYQFQLNYPVNLKSVQMKLDVDGPVFVYLLDNNGKIIKKSNGQGTGTWSWIKFTIDVELNNAYSAFLWATTSRKCRCKCVMNDVNLRTVNHNCSVLSKQICVNTDQNVGTVMSLQDNRDIMSVYMEIEVG